MGGEELGPEELQADQTEQSGFDADDDLPTETPGDDKAREPEPELVVEYAQLTRAEVDELKARAALIDEIKATQAKGFGTIGGTLRGIQQDLQAVKSGKRVEIDQKDIDSLREDFGPLAAALEKVRDMQVIHSGADPEAIERMVQERMGAAIETINTTVEHTVEKRLLSKAHPDWSEFQSSEAFAAWVNTQPDDYRAKLASTWDADFIADAMTKAKAAAKPKPAAESDSTRKNRIAAAVTPRGSGATRAPVGNDERAGFDAA